MTPQIKPGSYIYDLLTDGERINLQAVVTPMAEKLKCNHCVLKNSYQYCDSGYFKCNPNSRSDGANIFFEAVDDLTVKEKLWQQ